jgi:hypothetical protein
MATNTASPSAYISRAPAICYLLCITVAHPRLKTSRGDADAIDGAEEEDDTAVEPDEEEENQEEECGPLKARQVPGWVPLLLALSPTSRVQDGFSASRLQQPTARLTRHAPGCRPHL